MILNIVDFPTPLGPKSPKIWPLFILKFILLRINLFLNDKETSINSITDFVLLNDFILNFFIYD